MTGSEDRATLDRWFQLDPAIRVRRWSESARGDWMLWTLWRASGEPDTAGRQRLVLVAVQCAALCRRTLSPQYHAIFDKCRDACVGWAYTPSPVRLDALVCVANEMRPLVDELGNSFDGHALAAIGTVAAVAVNPTDDDSALYVVNHMLAGTYAAGLAEVEHVAGCPGWLATSFDPALHVASAALRRDLSGGSSTPKEEFGHEVTWRAPWASDAPMESRVHEPCRALLRECAEVIRSYYPEPPHSVVPDTPELAGEDEIVCRASEDLPLRVRAYALHCLVFAWMRADDVLKPLAARQRTGLVARIVRKPLPEPQRAMTVQVLCHYFVWDLTTLQSEWLSADPALVRRWRRGLIDEFRALTGRDPGGFMDAMDGVRRQRDAATATMAAASRYLGAIVGPDPAALVEQGFLLAGMGKSFVLALQRVRDQAFKSPEDVTAYFLRCSLDEMKRGLLMEAWEAGDLTLRAPASV